MVTNPKSAYDADLDEDIDWDMWSSRPIVKGTWPGRYPTLVEELPDSLADLPDWDEHDIRQLNSKVSKALFGSHANQASILPAVIQNSKIERREKVGVARSAKAEQGNFVNSQGLPISLQPDSSPAPFYYTSLSNEELESNEAFEQQNIPVPERNPLEIIDWTNPTGKGVRIEDAKGKGTYGARRVRKGEVGVHEGTHYIAAPGQDIDAITGGIVDSILSADYDGLIVGNNRGLSWMILYIDVDPSLSEGDYVKSGQVIGTSQDMKADYGDGMTNHVHVQLRVNWARVDPEGYIP